MLKRNLYVNEPAKTAHISRNVRLATATTRPSTTSKPKQSAQSSIRLQIDLPLSLGNERRHSLTTDRSELLTYMAGRHDNSITSSCSYDAPHTTHKTVSAGTTIRLQISFDASPRVSTTPRRRRPTSPQAPSTIAKRSDSSLTSGYFSSSNDTDDTDLEDQQGFNACSKRRSSFLHGPSHYDKLDYTAKRRFSVSSAESLSSSSSMASASNGTKNEIENIYEDISNFCASSIHNCNAHASDASFPMTARSALRREYTVNEIFQNLKSFKEQASQCEKLYEESPTVTVPVQTRSVSALKQLFETSSSSSSGASILRRIQRVKQLKGTRPEPQAVVTTLPHIYVNERVSKPVNV